MTYPDMHLDWPDISMAPKDGTVISAIDHAGNRFTCAFRDGRWKVTYPKGSIMGGLMDAMPVNPVRFEDEVRYAPRLFYVSDGEGMTLQSAEVQDHTKWS